MRIHEHRKEELLVFARISFELLLKISADLKP